MSTSLEIELTELKATILETVRQEMRDTGLFSEPFPSLPPPHDMDAEGEILGALLCGEIEIQELEPLRPSHFYGRFSRKLFDVLCGMSDRGEHVSLKSVAVALLDAGISGRVVTELESMCLQPFRLKPHVLSLVDVLIGHAAKRELITIMAHLDIGLRSGHVCYADARAVLLEYFSGR